MRATLLVIVHGLVAVALLGAITHQTLATWAPARAKRGSFLGRFRSVPPVSFANVIIVLYLVAALLGAIVYLDFRVDDHANPIGELARILALRMKRPK